MMLKGMRIELIMVSLFSCVQCFHLSQASGFCFRDLDGYKL